MQYIAKYLRKPNTKEPKGMLVAIKDEKGNIQYGWSLCDKKDSFNKKRAKEMALGRAKRGHGNKMPHSFKSLFKEGFGDRCKSYFQTDEIPEPIMMKRKIHDGCSWIVEEKVSLNNNEEVQT